jgi:hypothetical protein
VLKIPASPLDDDKDNCGAYAKRERLPWNEDFSSSPILFFRPWRKKDGVYVKVNVKAYVLIYPVVD